MGTRYEQTVAPTLSAVTTAEAKTHCMVTDSADDTYIAGLVSKATRYIERVSGRQLLTATWVARLDGFPDEIELRILPVASISSITYTDQDGTSQTLSSSNYQSDIEDHDSPGRIMPAYGYTWPETRGETYNAVVVTFVAGWTSAALIPDTYKHAVLLLTAHWFENREPVNIGNIVNAIPLSISSLLAAENWGSYA